MGVLMAGPAAVARPAVSMAQVAVMVAPQPALMGPQPSRSAAWAVAATASVLVAAGPWPGRTRSSLMRVTVAERPGASTPGQRLTRGRPIAPATRSSSPHPSFAAAPYIRDEVPEAE